MPEERATQRLLLKAMECVENVIDDIELLLDESSEPENKSYIAILRLLQTADRLLEKEENRINASILKA